MKNITLFLAMALGSLSINAQNTYTLTTTTGQTYTDLTGDTSINNGQTWDWDYFGEFTMPFPFTFQGEAVNRFLFEDDYFAFLTPTADYDSVDDYIEGVYVIYPTGVYIQDRNWGGDTSATPISWKVEGTAPNRIMKLQIKNAGAEDAVMFGYDSDEFYMNLQVWLYESDQAIEVRYGANNITDAFLENYEEEAEWTCVMLSDADTAYMAYGNPANATYGEFTEATFPDPGPTFDTYPASGTVYRFAPAGTTNAPVFAKNNFSLYPNPASAVVNIRANGVTEGQYAVYNMLGAVVAQGNLTGTDTAINTANLQEGVYVIKVDNQNLKFIKK